MQTEKEHCLKILEDVLDELYETANETEDSHRLLMTAHSVGIVQKIINRIEKEVPNDSRIYEVLP